MAAQPNVPPTKAKSTYVSGGHVLASLPFTTRISRSFDDIYNFFGLYFVSLLSLDPYTAAQNSRFNTRANRQNSQQNRPAWGSGSSQNTRVGGGNSTTARRPPGDPRSRNMGTIDDVREPECNTCG